MHNTHLSSPKLDAFGVAGQGRTRPTREGSEHRNLQGSARATDDSPQGPQDSNATRLSSMHEELKDPSYIIQQHNIAYCVGRVKPACGVGDWQRCQQECNRQTNNAHGHQYLSKYSRQAVLGLGWGKKRPGRSALHSSWYQDLLWAPNRKDLW